VQVANDPTKEVPSNRSCLANVACRSTGGECGVTRWIPPPSSVGWIRADPLRRGDVVDPAIIRK
jgi:hypothetical protein